MFFYPSDNFSLPSVWRKMNNNLSSFSQSPKFKIENFWIGDGKILLYGKVVTNPLIIVSSLAQPYETINQWYEELKCKHSIYQVILISC